MKNILENVKMIFCWVDESQIVQNKFKVVEIKDNKLVVCSIKEKRRRTFAL